ncbi:MAG: hypothetical protein LBJ90_01830 [Treponema sp.]|nr:hypothetical protein [Treponema sp.]
MPPGLACPATSGLLQ